MQFKHLNNEFGTVLKVDIDKKKISFFTLKSIQLLSRNFTLKKFILKKSPSKKGWHIILCLKEEMTDSELIAWQFALGSDKRRERYNLLRHTHGNKMIDWNILFSNKINRKISFKDSAFFSGKFIPINYELKDFHGQKYLTKIKKKKEKFKIKHNEEEFNIYQDDFK